MILKSKADTILNLQKYDLKFLIPETYVFSITEWKLDKKKIIKKIKAKFSSKIVVRSSSYDEDLINQSQAGKYLSILDINPKKIKQINRAINKVIRSYKKNNKENKVIIQKQTTKVSMSGVIFTHELTKGSPYYVINYDDNSKKTYTVTSGIGKDSNKKLIIYRKGINSLKSARFKKLINAVLDLEKKLKNNHLDIEFVVDIDLKIYLLQVRNISIKKKFNDNNSLIKKIILDKKLLNNKLKRKQTILAQMSDWNPAEIIGKNPKILSSSLYSALVTDKCWSIAREQMGYGKLSDKKLMFLFSGKPYIDVRKSFYSFLPRGINANTKNKIVNFWIKKLYDHPYLHDKIEFEIAITSFSFDIHEKLTELLPNKIINTDKNKIKFLYKKIFIQNIKQKNESSLENIRKKIEKLKINQINFKVEKSKKKNLGNLKKTINNCKNLGIVPFAQAARHGFIAKCLTDSLIKKRAMNKQRVIKLQKSIHTITSEFLEDINLVIQKKIKKNQFIRKYGHLRPGAYDINSKNYKSMQKYLFNRISFEKKNSFILNKKEKNRISLLLKKNKINFNPDFMINYIKEATRLREYSKFIFTKSIDQIFNLMIAVAPKNFKKREILSFFTVSEIMNNKLNKNLLFKRKKEYEINSKIFLPEVIKDKYSYDVIPYMFNVPNFITSNKIMGKVIFLDNKLLKNLNGKIILIENADPGFDWIFTKRIKGFVTQYGGSNSHMAIRAAELNIPAVIGCGQKKFEELKASSDIEIDTLNKKIEILR